MFVFLFAQKPAQYNKVSNFIEWNKTRLHITDVIPLLITKPKNENKKLGGGNRKRGKE